MKQFKYALAIEGSEEEQRALIPKLDALGHEKGETLLRVGRFRYLVTNFAINKSGYYGFGLFSRGENHRIHVPASNPDLVLALAAMVDDEVFHEGEIGVIVKGGWGAYSLDVGLLFKVIGQGHGQLLSPSRKKGGVNTYIGIINNPEYYRKATKEEIISHFNKNNMNEQNLSNGVKAERSFAVSEYFIKEAHAAACEQWKEKIENEFPSLFSKPFKVGDRIVFYNTEYLIAGGNGRVVLVNTKTGQVSRETVGVSDLKKITLDELVIIGDVHGLNHSTVITRL